MTNPAFLPPLPLSCNSHSLASFPLSPSHPPLSVRFNSNRARIQAVAPSTSHQHNPAPSSSTPPPAALRLSAGVRARTVVHICSSGTLCTSLAKHNGVPFGSHADFVLDDDGRPVFLLANNATHTKNLLSESRCSLFCQPTTSSGQEGCRTTLVGRMAPLSEEEVELRERYVQRHAHAADALNYPDSFAFYRMAVDDVFFVGGYGVVSQWVDALDFASAEADPLAFDAPQIVKGINEGKGEELRRLCHVFLGVVADRCVMTSLDRLGFDLRVWDEEGVIREYRVAFREVVANRFDVQSALVKAFQEAWERENGYDETWAGEDTRQTVLYYSPL